MESPWLDPRYEPPQIKAALPVEWALGHLFGVWGAGSGEMISCPLPDHGDSTPSFNLWAPNDDGVPMRWGCFGCGANGDVIDLIRVARDVGFTEACTIAVERLLPTFELDDWTPAEPLTEVRAAASPAQLMAKTECLKADDRALRIFLDKKGLEVPAEYLAEEWYWMGAYAGMPIVAFPYLDWDHRLRGIRYRSVRRGNRWSEKGSRFELLYGAWRDRGEPYVLLAEGETDTVHADWELKDMRLMRAMGLASGAAQKPPEPAVERLAGRLVWLAFDGDMAGRIATNRWKAALDGLSRVFTCPIPEGKDLRTAGIPVVELMEGAGRD